ncbi:hypothetical protein MKK65_22305 [Methylobacterium sp. J-001]|uniref:hypothetical protein n=1 Tax=Methylobacterium sp. J-001 TaxID=2836609 RepID=UPI001FBB3537|nr:hypothetical protein [Methylobacterium sp. J-001]MCJ2119267.1 hypothetical protein [Methylobacterium sp. J-001]
MKKTTFALAAATLLSSLTLGVGNVSAAPMSVNGLQSNAGITQVRMMHGDRMMMKKRMMHKKMMRRRMMMKHGM